MGLGTYPGIWRVKRSIVKKLSAILCAFTIVFAPIQPGWAIFGLGDIVFDPGNHAQNLLTAARTLTMINNQIRQLQNEARMLTNQARHLQRLDFNSVHRLNRMLSRINILMNEANGFTLHIESIERDFRQFYPEQYGDHMTNDELVRDASRRWKYSMQSYRHNLTMQAAVIETAEEDHALIGDMVASSQGAGGSLEVQQATNQLIALTAQQNVKTQQLMAAYQRSQTLASAERASAIEASRARFARFIGDGKAYSPLR